MSHLRLSGWHASRWLLVLTLVPLLLAAPAPISRAAPVRARLAGTLLALLALAFVPFLNYSNLLGFRW